MVGLVGVEVRVRVIARAGSERRSTSKVTSSAHEMFKRCSSQEPRESRAKRAICDSHVVFQQSDLPLPTGGLSNPIVRMGRSPAHVQACWAGILGDVISSLLGRINLSIFIHV